MSLFQSENPKNIHSGVLGVFSVDVINLKWLYLQIICQLAAGNSRFACKKHGRPKNRNFLKEYMAN